MSAILLASSAGPGCDQRFRLSRRPDRLMAEHRHPAVRVLCWKPPRGCSRELPNLKAIFSLGAGVDHLIGDPTLPDLPVVRIVDPDLTMRMTEYVVLQVLMIHRRQRMYDAQQAERRWLDHDQRPASAVSVGIMGLGVLGSDAAEVLRRIGFQVAGWSRTRKSIPGIETFHGTEGLDAFLRRSEILVCLLPHTPATEGILNLACFGAQARRRARRRVSHQCRPRQAAGRGRHPGGPRRRRTRGRDPRRVPGRAIAVRKPAVGASQDQDHAAQRGGVRCPRARRQRAATRSRGSSAANRSSTWWIARRGIEASSRPSRGDDYIRFTCMVPP